MYGKKQYSGRLSLENDGYHGALTRLALQVMGSILKSSIADGVADGKLLLLLPSERFCVEARALLSMHCAESGMSELALSRLHVTDLGGGHAWLEGEELAVVLFAGISLDASPQFRDSPALRFARVLRRSAAVSVCLNADIPMLRFERHSVCQVFVLKYLAIERELLPFPGAGGTDHFTDRLWVTPEGEARPRSLGVTRTQELGKVLIRRAYPGGWGVAIDFGETGEYTQLETLAHRPMESEIIDIIEPSVKARLAALGPAMVLADRLSGSPVRGLQLWGSG